MLPETIPYLYDNAGEANGLAYGSDVAYMVKHNIGEADYAFDRLSPCYAMRYSSDYCPMVNSCIRKYKSPFSTGLDQFCFDPNDVYDNVNLGQRGVIMTYGSPLGQVFPAEPLTLFLQDLPQGNPTGTGSTLGPYPWYRDMLLSDIQEGTVIRYRKPTLDFYIDRFSSARIITSFDREHYIIVPNVRCVSSTGDVVQCTWGQYLSTYAGSHPYITHVYYFARYKQTLMSEDIGVSVDIAAVGGNSRKLNFYASYYSSQPGDARTRYYGAGDYIFSSKTLAYKCPVIYGQRIYYNGNYYNVYTGVGGLASTHGTQFVHYLDTTPKTGSQTGDLGTIAYITQSTAEQMINALGFWWVGDFDDIKQAKGENTTSPKVHIPVIDSTGSTTPSSYTGDNMSQEWTNPNVTPYTGDLITGKIDLKIPPDRSWETGQTDLTYGDTSLLPQTALLNGLGSFANYYALTKVQVDALNDYLWTSDENIINAILHGLSLFGENPINSIMSLRLYPFNVGSLLGTSATYEEICLGRVRLGVSAYKIASNSNTVIDLGSVYIAPYYYDFRDYSPYTSFNLYIPFIGTIPLDPATYLGHVINVKMSVDFTTGKATAAVYSDNIPIEYLDGMVGVEIPITGDNMAQFASQTINAVGSAGASITAGIMTGCAATVLGVAKGAGDLVDGAYNQIGVTKVGNVSPAASLALPTNAYLIVARPESAIPSTYGHSYGYVCRKGGTVASFSGFTVFENVDVSSVNGTEREQTELKSILEGGIYI